MSPHAENDMNVPLSASNLADEETPVSRMSAEVAASKPASGKEDFEALVGRLGV